MFIIQTFFAFGQQVKLLVGSYTSKPEEGISIYSFNTTDGSAKLMHTVPASNPSYLAVSPGQKHVYAVNELSQKEGGGQITSYHFINDTLVELNRQSSEGEHPCYISVDRSGKWVIAGNYSSGNFTLLPVLQDGSLGVAKKVIQHSGKSITDRQKGPHVHATLFSPDNKYVIVSDLGIDQVLLYAFDENTGELSSLPISSIHTQPGAGPRHFIFSNDGKYGYLMEELSGKVSVFEYHEGRLTFMQTISSLPSDFKSKFTSADIHISKHGKHLYTSTRDELNAISVFNRDDATGKLILTGHQPALGKTPRNFSPDPSGNFLLVANQNSNQIVIFQIDSNSGKLTDTGNRIEVNQPVCIKWITQ